MHVHFRILATAFYQTLTRTPFSLRRGAVLLMFLAVFLPFECLTWICLKLDTWLYPAFRTIRVERPVFIMGNPRSGTSYFHRLMALDTERFTHVRLVDIVLPSIVQQTVLAWVGRLDRRFGAPLHRLVRWVERHATQASDKIRRIHLEEPEEDEMVLVHAFATSTLLMMFPGAEILAPLVRYDELDAGTRRSIDDFYAGFVRRHVYRCGDGRRFLSKNTTFPTKLRSLLALFPDARIIWLIRNPAVSIASTVDMFDRFWRTQFGDKGLEKQKRRLIETAFYLYRHALEVLNELPPERVCTVQYEALVADPVGTVKQVYRTLGMDMDEAFESRLQAAGRQGKRFKSRHEYTLAAVGLSEEDIEATLAEVYGRFEFRERVGVPPRHEHDGTSPPG